VTPLFSFKAGAKTIHIATTQQKLSGHAGQATFWSFLHRLKVPELLARVLPHRPQSNNALSPVGIACSFIAGVLAGAERLAQVAWLRADPVLPELLATARVPSQSTFSRFLAQFTAGTSLQCFRQLWRWTLEQVPARRAGYTLDLDTSALLHEDGHQEGVAIGHTRFGLKPCLQPMLAVLAEVGLCVQFWLRPGNAHCSNNLLNFTKELLRQLPHHLHLRLVRADAGFYDDRWLSLLEEKQLPYIVVTDLSVRVKSLIKKTTRWWPTKVAGLEVAEVLYESKSASKPRRLILIRRRLDGPHRGGGKLLFDCPGYQYQVLVTSLPESFTTLQVWYEYNGRANIENVIKELKDGFGLGGFCCRGFYATEAALSLAVMTYNWTVLFARHLGWLDKVTIQTLRYRLFRSAGVLSYGQGRTTIRLGIPEAQRTWWAEVWEKILCPFPNCNAVAQTP
jgi:DNA-directed RNA polymerase subunit N (RpoN/RPB10)